MEDLRRPTSHVIGLYRLDFAYSTYEDEFKDLNIQRWTGSVLEQIDKDDIPEDAWVFKRSFDLDVREDIEDFFNFISDCNYGYNEEVELIERLFKVGYYYDYLKEYKYTADWV